MHPGADFASRPDQLVRLGLLFHVLFVSRLSPPAPAQVRQVGSNVGALKHRVNRVERAVLAVEASSSAANADD